jgi:hypothetical protein
MTRKTPRAAWLLLLAVLAFAAAGCGGGDDSSSGDDSSDDQSSSSDALSEDDFLAQFDEVCIGIKEDLDAIDPPTTNDELADAASQASDIAEPGVAALRDITPPDDLADDVDGLLDTLEEQVGLYDDLQQAAEDGDDDAITDLGGQLDEGESSLDEQGSDIGLECFVDEEDSSDDFSDSSDDFSDSSDAFSDDFSDSSDDFSDDSSDSGSGTAPQDAIPEYGTDANFDALADACYIGDFESCDELFRQSASGSGYEAYGDTCGGLQAQHTGQYCADVFG